MKKVCPLCNGLEKLHIKCERCQEEMIDGGILSDYYDDYSPYLPMEITDRIDGVKEDQCVHLFYCSSCGIDHRIIIEKEKV